MYYRNFYPNQGLNNNIDNRNYYQNTNPVINQDERFGGFFVPFLLGGLTGGAAVAVSRPRPVVVNPYQPYPPYYGPGPYYGPRPY